MDISQNPNQKLVSGTTNIKATNHCFSVGLNRSFAAQAAWFAVTNLKFFTRGVSLELFPLSLLFCILLFHLIVIT
jgi:hypothetical protein